MKKRYSSIKISRIAETLFRRQTMKNSRGICWRLSKCFGDFFFKKMKVTGIWSKKLFWKNSIFETIIHFEFLSKFLPNWFFLKNFVCFWTQTCSFLPQNFILKILTSLSDSPYKKVSHKIAKNPMSCFDTVFNFLFDMMNFKCSIKLRPDS